MIHIGTLIEKELRQNGHTVVWFSRQLFCNRQNVYDIFQRKSIDTDLLMRISLVLRHNFFRELDRKYEQTKKEVEQKENEAASGNVEA